MLSRWKEAVGTTSPLAVFAVTSWHFLEAGDHISFSFGHVLGALDVH